MYRLEGYEGVGFFKDMDTAYNILTMLENGSFVLLKHNKNIVGYVYIESSETLDSITRMLESNWNFNKISNVNSEDLITGIDLLGGIFDCILIKCAGNRLLLDNLVDLQPSSKYSHSGITTKIIQLQQDSMSALKLRYNGFSTNSSVFSEFLRTSAFVLEGDRCSVVNSGYSVPTAEFLSAVSSRGGFIGERIVSAKDIKLSLLLDSLICSKGTLHFYSRITLAEFLANPSYYSFCVSPVCGVTSCI